MGSPETEAGRYEREGPVREITIAEPFAISVYEITRGEYARFVRATNYLGGNTCLVNEGPRLGATRRAELGTTPEFRKVRVTPLSASVGTTRQLMSTG